MFAINCPVHGFLLDVECYCGTHVVVGTGRNYVSRSVPALVA